MEWFPKKEAAVRRNTVIMRCYSESLETAVTAKAGFLRKGHISSAASLVYEVCSGLERKSERGQRRRKRRNSDLKWQPMISNEETAAVCSTPKYAGKAASQHMPGANTGMGTGPGTQWTLPAQEGKIIPALQGKQDLSLVNIYVSIRLTCSKLSYM